MLSSSLLDVALGLALIFSLLSVIASMVREAWESLLKTRAQDLHEGIKRLLSEDEAQVEALYTHPLVEGLYKGTYAQAKPGVKARVLSVTGLPSYIPSRIFARALIDLTAAGGAANPGAAAGPGAGRELLSRLRGVVDGGRPEMPVVSVIRAALDEKGGDLAAVQRHVEEWYDDAMERVTGAYKRRTQLSLFLIAVVVTVSLNANTIVIANYLARKDAVRETVVSAAIAAAQTNPGTAVADSALGALRRLDLPIGWSGSSPRIGAGLSSPGVWNDWLMPIGGLLLTALAMTLGAPFWFDVLNRFIQLRSAVKPREKDAAPPATTSMPTVTRDVGERAQAPIPIGLAPDPEAALEVALAQSRVPLWRPGVVSIGGGMKLHEGRPTPCIVVRVSEKLMSHDELAMLASFGELLPRTVTARLPSGESVEVPVDVIQDGIPTASGCGIGGPICNNASRSNTGTLGAVIKRAGNPADHLLTCYHVVRVDHPWSGFVPMGHEEVMWAQNGAYSPVGTMSFGFRRESGDLALVCLNDGVSIDHTVPGLGGPASGVRAVSWSDLFSHTQVQVAGMTSPVPTTGTVAGFQESPVLTYADGSTQHFVGLFAVAAIVGTSQKPITQPGDSGALVCDAAGVAIGIVVGAGASVTYVMPLAGHFKDLGLRLS